MQLDDVNRKKLTGKGLQVYGDNYRFIIVKPSGMEGNFIPTWRKQKVYTGFDPFEEEEIDSDCPSLTLEYQEKKWHTTVWDWIPGPGPGDFHLTFEDQNEAIEFVISYYFEENEYFRARKNYAAQARDGIELNELKKVLEISLDGIKNCFDDNEFVDFENGSYYKLPSDAWKCPTPTMDNKHKFVEFDFGVLGYDAFQLKDLIYKERKFEPEDLERLASVFTELAILYRKKNGS